MEDTSQFPDPVYRETVLEPLFDGARDHFSSALSAINRAHLVMLRETGILDRKMAGAIASALADIDQNTDPGSLRYTGEVEDYFFFVEAELVARVGRDVAGALHTARSRNDIDHTIFKLVLADRADTLIASVHGLVQAMVETAERNTQTIVVAYTHGQPAQATTFGHYLSAAIEVLLRDLDRLHQARDGLSKCPMGAAAITTSGFPIDRARVAELLGFREPLRNSYGCIAAVDYVTGLYSAMKLLFLHLGRLIQDFQFWSAFEVGQLYVPNSFVQISSIMPQKRNPVPIEHLRLLSSLTVGRCDMVVNTMHNTPFTDMNDSEGEVQQAGHAAFDSGQRVIALMTALIPALSIRQDRVQAIADAACVTITELADTLVRSEAISFRQAHKVAAETSRAIIAADKTLLEGYADFSEAFLGETGRKTTLEESAFRSAVSVENFVTTRDRYGGPGPTAMQDALAAYRAELAEFEARSKAHKKRSAKADKDLRTAFSDLTD